MKKFIIASLFAVALTGCINYSDGDRSGVITKFSHKGVFFKTWEGQMNLGGSTTNGDGNIVANTWNFTVEDPAMVERVKHAFESGKHVTLHYNQEVVGSASRGSTNYFITDVKEQ